MASDLSCACVLVHVTLSFTSRVCYRGIHCMLSLRPQVPGIEAPLHASDVMQALVEVDQSRHIATADTAVRAAPLSKGCAAWLRKTPCFVGPHGELPAELIAANIMQRFAVDVPSRGAGTAGDNGGDASTGRSVRLNNVGYLGGHGLESRQGSMQMDSAATPRVLPGGDAYAVVTLQLAPSWGQAAGGAIATTPGSDDTSRASSEHGSDQAHVDRAGTSSSGLVPSSPLQQRASDTSAATSGTGASGIAAQAGVATVLDEVSPSVSVDEGPAVTAGGLPGSADVASPAATVGPTDVTLRMSLARQHAPSTVGPAPVREGEGHRQLVSAISAGAARVPAVDRAAVGGLGVRAPAPAALSIPSRSMAGLLDEPGAPIEGAGTDRELVRPGSITIASPGRARIGKSPKFASGTQVAHLPDSGRGSRRLAHSTTQGATRTQARSLAAQWLSVRDRPGAVANAPPGRGLAHKQSGMRRSVGKTAAGASPNVSGRKPLRPPPWLATSGNSFHYSTSMLGSKRLLSTQGSYHRNGSQIAMGSGRHYDPTGLEHKSTLRHLRQHRKAVTAANLHPLFGGRVTHKVVQESFGQSRKRRIPAGDAAAALDMTPLLSAAAMGAAAGSGRTDVATPRQQSVRVRSVSALAPQAAAEQQSAAAEQPSAATQAVLSITLQLTNAAQQQLTALKVGRVML